MTTPTPATLTAAATLRQLAAQLEDTNRTALASIREGTGTPATLTPSLALGARLSAAAEAFRAAHYPEAARVIVTPGMVVAVDAHRHPLACLPVPAGGAAA